MTKLIKTVDDLAHFMDILDTDLSNEWVDQRELSVSEDTGPFFPSKNYSLSGFNVSDKVVTLEFFANNEFVKDPKITLGALRGVLTNEELKNLPIEACLTHEDGTQTTIDEFTELDKGHSSNHWYLETPEL